VNIMSETAEELFENINRELLLACEENISPQARLHIENVQEMLAELQTFTILD